MDTQATIKELGELVLADESSCDSIARWISNTSGSELNSALDSWGKGFMAMVSVHGLTKQVQPLCFSKAKFAWQSLDITDKRRVFAYVLSALLNKKAPMKIDLSQYVAAALSDRKTYEAVEHQLKTALTRYDIDYVREAAEQYAKATNRVMLHAAFYAAVGDIRKYLDNADATFLGLGELHKRRVHADVCLHILNVLTENTKPKLPEGFVPWNATSSSTNPFAYDKNAYVDYVMRSWKPGMKYANDFAGVVIWKDLGTASIIGYRRTDAPEGFLPWTSHPDGPGCPVTGNPHINVVLSNGNHRSGAARSYNWNAHPSATHIVAYRVIDVVAHDDDVDAAKYAAITLKYEKAVQAYVKNQIDNPKENNTMSLNTTIKLETIEFISIAGARAELTKMSDDDVIAQIEDIRRRINGFKDKNIESKKIAAKVAELETVEKRLIELLDSR